MRAPLWPVVAVVTGHDPSNDALIVGFPALQMPGLSIRRIYDGSADSLRISKKPLPVRGTHGIVLFPHGDFRNAVWLGAVQQNLADAIPSDANDPFMRYESHFSGHWELLDQYGNSTISFADGSSFAANASGGTVPTIYRHVVDQSQVQQRVALTAAERNPSPPAPFAFVFSQAASGSNGGVSFSTDASGNTTLSCSTTGHTSTISYNGATIQIDANGNIIGTPAGGAFFVIDGTLHVTGNVIAGYGGGDSVTLQSHTHDQPNDSAGDTEATTDPPNAGT